MAEENRSTRISFDAYNGGVLFRFTDYTAEDELTEETPVTYELFLSEEDLDELRNKVDECLRNVRERKRCSFFGRLRTVLYGISHRSD